MDEEGRRLLKNAEELRNVLASLKYDMETRNRIYKEDLKRKAAFKKSALRSR